MVNDKLKMNQMLLCVFLAFWLSCFVLANIKILVGLS